MRGVWPTRAIVACSALLAFAAPAHASTQIGMVATSDADNCTPNTEFMQNTVGTGGPTPSYDVPAPGGVITSWSTKPGPGTGTGARLKVYRPTSDANTWTVVGESAAKILTPDTENTGLTRISVQPGDRIGVRTASGNGGPCDFPYPAGLGPGYSIFAFQASPDQTVDPATGDSVLFFDDGIEELVNIAAVVEPDADGDGFGDETQDLCPGSTGPTNGCVPPTPPASPAPPPAPVLHVKAAARHIQHVLRQHGIVLTVQPNVASTVTATATVSVPAASVVLRCKRVTRNVAAGAKATLRLKLSKAQLRRVKKALRRHRRLTAKAVLTTSAAGKRVVAHRRIRIVR